MSNRVIMPNSEYLFENETMFIMGHAQLLFYLSTYWFQNQYMKTTTTTTFILSATFRFIEAFVILQRSKFINLNSTDKENEAQRSQ